MYGYVIYARLHVYTRNTPAFFISLSYGYYVQCLTISDTKTFDSQPKQTKPIYRNLAVN